MASVNDKSKQFVSVLNSPPSMEACLFFVVLVTKVTAVLNRIQWFSVFTFLIILSRISDNRNVYIGS